MPILNKIKNHPSLNFADDLKTICAPLNKLGIAYFSHVRVDSQGKFAAIGLEPEFVKLYFQKKYYNFDIHMAKAHQSEQYYLWDAIERKKESKKLYDDFRGFELDHTFTIVQENAGNKDCYHFSAKAGNDAINYMYLQNIDLLKKYISYFNEKVNTNKELSQAYEIKFQLEQDHGGYFISNELAKNHIEFNQEINLDRIYLDKDRYLTKREMECLLWLAKGKTLEEIAIILGITVRTIKAHMSNMKKRLDCFNQFQLGMLYQELSKLKNY